MINYIVISVSLVLLAIFLQAYLYKRKLKSLKNALSQEKTKSTHFATQLAEIKEEYTQHASKDYVTGLPSRSVFEERWRQIVSQSQRYEMLFGVLALDIDDFKLINNTLGHHLGDKLLRQVAVRILDSLRKIDIAARFSGDNFVIVLPQISKPDVCAYVAQRLLDVLSQPFTLSEKEVFVTASIGITTYPQDGSDVNTLLQSAEIALHQARLRGCNSYQFFSQNMQEMAQKHLLLRTSLHNASVYDEFILHYQPLVNVKNKEIFCMEALLRWNHPQLGVLAPNQFLTFAENSGKIIEIGEWILVTVCKQFSQWKEAGLRVKKIAVNLSLRQLEHPQFVFNFSKILQKYQIPPESIVFDISDAIFTNLNLFEKNLILLKQLGVALSIDDFGIEHLSLQVLRQFSIDYLKIDSTLVQALLQQPESEVIAKMVIDLANALHLGVIAEGVETKDQQEKLQKMGCYLMQGHYFSLPCLPEEFTASVEKSIEEKV